MIIKYYIEHSKLIRDTIKHYWLLVIPDSSLLKKPLK